MTTCEHGNPVRPEEPFTNDQCRVCWIKAGGKDRKPSAPSPPPRVYAKCIHLGDRVPGTPCGSTLYRCNLYGDVTSRVRKCREASRSCGQCPESRSFPPAVTRNLLYHVYPVKNSNWLRRVLRIKERLSLFNGMRVFAVAEGPETDDAMAVGRALEGERVELITVRNDPGLWETASHRELFSRLSARRDPGEVTLWGHAKAVTRPPWTSCHRWADVMEEALTDYWPACEDVLRFHPICGAFKKVGRGWSPDQSSSSWHYSGSWFWFRNESLFSRPWEKTDRFVHGMETYSSLHFTEREAGCVFHEGTVPVMNLYSLKYWNSVVEPGWASFVGNNSSRKLDWDSV